MTPEELVRKIFEDMNAADSSAGAGSGWLAGRLDAERYREAFPQFWTTEDGEAIVPKIMFRETLADSVVEHRNRDALRGSGDVIWVTSVVVAEPRVATFDGDFREWTAIQFIIHIPAFVVQHGVGYQILKDMDQEVMRRLRGRYTDEERVAMHGSYVNPNRMVNSTFVADFPAEGRAIERNRTVLVR